MSRKPDNRTQSVIAWAGTKRWVYVVAEKHCAPDDEPVFAVPGGRLASWRQLYEWHLERGHMVDRVGV